MAVTWEKLAYEDDVVTKALFDAYSVLAADADNTPAALTVGASTIVGRAAAGGIVALTAAQVRTIINVASGATANTKATGAELDTGTNDVKFATAKALKDAHNVPSVVPGAATNVLTSDGTDWTSAAAGAPAAHKDTHDPQDGVDALDTAAPEELVGVQASGVGSSHSFARADHQHQIQESFANNHLVTVNAADVAANDVARFSVTGGLNGMTYTELAAAMALDDIGEPDAAVGFAGQQATDLVVHSVADAAARGALTPVIGKLVFQVDELTFYGCTIAV